METDHRRGSKEAAAAAASAVALFLVARLPLLRSSMFDTTEQQPFGLLPLHLVDGMLVPLPAYIPQAQEGCALPFGFLCAPVVGVVGPTLGALRICNLVWHALMAATVAAVLLLRGGRLAALVGAALFALAPPSLVHYGHKGWSTHVDAGLWLLLAWLVAPRPGQWAPRRLVAAGLLVSVATFHLLDAAFAGVIALSAVALSAGRGRVLHATGLTAVGLLAGLPLLLLGGGPFSEAPVRTALEATAFVDLPQRLLSGVLPRLGSAWDISDGLAWLPSVWARALYLGGLLLAVGSGCIGASRWLAAPCLGGAALHVLAITLSGADAGYPGYYAPVWTLLVLGAGAGCAAGSRFRLPAVCGAGLSAAIGLASISAQRARVDEQRLDAEAVATAEIADRLLCARVEQHRAAERLIVLGPDALMRLAAARPNEVAGLALLAGRAAVRESVGGLPGLSLPPLTQPGPRQWFWEGAGFEWLESRVSPRIRASGQRQLDEAVRTLEGLELAPGFGGLPDADAAAMRTGAARSLVLAVWQVEALPLPSLPESRAAICGAFGWRGFERREQGAVDRRVGRVDCDGSEVARGAGIAIARAIADGPAGPAPELSVQVLWPGRMRDEAFVRSLTLEYRAERDRLRAARGWLP